MGESQREMQTAGKSSSPDFNIAIDIANTLKKMTYIHLKLYQYDESLDLLSKVLKIQEKFYDRDDREIRDTKKLINGVNYHILKFHNPFTNRTLDFSYLGKVEDELDCRSYAIVKPK